MYFGASGLRMHLRLKQMVIKSCLCMELSEIMAMISPTMTEIYLFVAFETVEIG
jgi:hypothetical protein